MTTLLEFHDVQVKGGKTIILDIPELSVEKGEVLVVLGPNGAGKSTLLQTAAGLIKPTNGSVFFTGSKNQTNLEYRRKISTVFQSPLLLSDTVEHNIASGLKFRGLKGKEIHPRVSYWMEQLHISHLAKRRANTLSGGEAQRVSLARAFCLETELILMDEPFSALDAPTRLELLSDLRDIFAKINQTCIYVTHELEESLTLGDRVAILFNGKIHQLGSATQVFTHPETPEIATFVGVENIIPGIVKSSSQGLMQIEASTSIFEAVGNLKEETTVYVCFRPEDITLCNIENNSMKTSARNHLRCRVIQLINHGALMQVRLDAGFPLMALITRPSSDELKLTTGKDVFALVKSTAIHLIES